MKKVCIQGLGFVGASMAVALSTARDKSGSPSFDIVGIELPTKLGKKRVNDINGGKFPFITSDQSLLDALSIAHSTGNISASVDDSALKDADIILVSIHLDISYLDKEPVIEFDNFKNAIRSIGKHIKPGALLIIETTVPPGTCEKIVKPQIEQELQKRGMTRDSYLLAHSYERVMPGDEYLDSIINFWRVYAGDNEAAADACEQFLTEVINVEKYPLTRLSSTLASETAKILENSYRASNIAFIDEWSKFAENVGIDLFEVVDAIRLRPTHSNIRFPGLGVGGYCLTKDPAFVKASVRQIFNQDMNFPFVDMTININNEMTLHAAKRMEKLLGGNINNKRILICGVSYKQDIDDTRNSPSEILFRYLNSRGSKLSATDPLVTYWAELDIDILADLPEADCLDGIIFAVGHQEYKKIDINSWLHNCNAIVLDANNVLTDGQKNKAREAGISIEMIGKADGL